MPDLPGIARIFGSARSAAHARTGPETGPEAPPETRRARNAPRALPLLRTPGPRNGASRPETPKTTETPGHRRTGRGAAPVAVAAPTAALPFLPRVADALPRNRTISTPRARTA